MTILPKPGIFINLQTSKTKSLVFQNIRPKYKKIKKDIVTGILKVILPERNTPYSAILLAILQISCFIYNVNVVNNMLLSQTCLHLAYQQIWLIKR